LFQSWKNVKDLLKMQNSKTREFQNEIDKFNKKCALRKWYRRKYATKAAKYRVNKLNSEFKAQRLRAYFLAMKKQFLISRTLSYRLANLANIHNQQAYKIALNAISSFAKAKAFVF
jgi:hypothetical protein